MTDPELRTYLALALWIIGMMIMVNGYMLIRILEILNRREE